MLTGDHTDHSGHSYGEQEGDLFRPWSPSYPSWFIIRSLAYREAIRMVSMIEKCARAVAAELREQRDEIRLSGLFDSENIARACIQALMEPSEEMAKVGADYEALMPWKAKEMWIDMLTAILKEKP